MTGGQDQAVAAVTGWQLRAGLLVCCLLSVVTAVSGETAERLGAFSLVGTVLLVAGVVAVPDSLLSTAFLAVLCLAMLDRGDPSLLRLVLMAALMHAVHVLAALAALGPASTRFAVAGLLPSLRRWAVAQVLALPVVLAVWWAASSGAVGSGVSDRVEIGAGALALLVLFGAVTLARRRMR